MKLNIKRGLAFLLVLTLITSVMPFSFAEEQQGWTLKSDTTYSHSGSGNSSVVYNDKIYIFGGKDSSNNAIYTEMYDPTTDKWITRAPMTIPRGNFQSVLIGDKAYVIGGIGNGKVLEVYDFASDKWEIKSSMSYSALGAEAQFIDGKLYVFGGTYYSSLEVYDPQLDTWEIKAPMLTTRSDFQSQVIDNKLYVFGGKTSSNGYTNAVEVYDPQANTWTQLSPMLTPRASFETEVVEGKIYAFGGESVGNTYDNKLEVYDIKTDSWTQLASMEESRGDFRSFVIGKSIYAINGRNRNSVSLDTVERYDINSNQWEQTQTTKDSKVQFQAQRIGNTLYIIGGGANSRKTEAYTLANTDLSPSLTVTASPNKVKVGNRFTTTVAIHNVSNIYAEDIKIDYDSDLFEYIGASAKDGLKIYKEDTTTPGSVRFIVAHLGQGNKATGDKDLIELTFKAKSVGIGKVDITKGRIADNDTLEMDIAEEDCGEDTIEVEANKDVNRTGEYTLLDLGIDSYYYGMTADQTDSTRFDTDVIPDGVIDDKDLSAITQSILDNSNYPFN